MMHVPSYTSKHRQEAGYQVWYYIASFPELDLPPRKTSHCLTFVGCGQDDVILSQCVVCVSVSAKSKRAGMIGRQELLSNTVRWLTLGLQACGFSSCGASYSCRYFKLNLLPHLSPHSIVVMSNPINKWIASSFKLKWLLCVCISNYACMHQ